MQNRKAYGAQNITYSRVTRPSSAGPSTIQHIQLRVSLQRDYCRPTRALKAWLARFTTAHLPTLHVRAAPGLFAHALVTTLRSSTVHVALQPKLRSQATAVDVPVAALACIVQLSNVTLVLPFTWTLFVNSVNLLNCPAIPRKTAPPPPAHSTYQNDD